MPQIAAIDVAIDAIGFFHRVELRLVFGEDLAALGEAVVVDEDVEIVPDRLGEFRLRIDQVHDAQIGRKPRGEALEILARDVAPCGIRPHRGDAIVEIRRRLADRGRGHQGVAGGAVLAAPGRRRRRPPSGPGAACGAGPDFGPEKMLPKKFESPSRRRIERGPGLQTRPGWNTAAPPRSRSRRFDWSSLVPSTHAVSVPQSPRFRRPVTVSNSLTEAEFCCRPRPAQGQAKPSHHTSAFVPGCKPATNVQSKHFPSFLSRKAPDIP